jgi:hypothetical protein
MIDVGDYSAKAFATVRCNLKEKQMHIFISICKDKHSTIPQYSGLINIHITPFVGHIFAKCQPTTKQNSLARQ